MTEKRVLLHIKHTWMDIFRFPILVEIIAIVLMIIIYFTSNYQYGYFIKITSLAGLIMVVGVFLFAFVLLPGIIAFVIWKNDMHLDEYVYLEGDEIVLEHGDKEIFRGKANALKEIWIAYGGARESYFHFKFNKKFGKYTSFLVGDGIALRKWITEEDMTKKGLELYNFFKKYNQDLKLIKWTKKREIWDGKEWKPIAVSELKRILAEQEKE